MLQGVLGAIEHQLGLALLHAEELVDVRVHVGADLVARLPAPHHQLHLRAGVEHAAEVVVLEGALLDVGEVALFHLISPLWGGWIRGAGRFSQAAHRPGRYSRSAPLPALRSGARPRIWSGRLHPPWRG